MVRQLRSSKLLPTKGSCTPVLPLKQWNTQLQVIRRTFTSHYTERPKLLRPFIFTACVSCASFATCAIVQYERRRSNSIVRNFWDQFQQHTTRMRKEFQIREQLKQWWDGLGEGRKMAAIVIGMNVMVCGAWQLRRTQPFMQRWFTHSPDNPRSLPLLLSCFSHVDLWHFGVNMYVLWNFAPHIHQILGSEQTAAFYLAGGCVSSLVSHYAKVAMCAFNPSVGASGALLAVLGACCIKNPDAELQIIFLPFITFSAQTALTGMIAVDACGLLFRWRLFDHAAHLGGTLFGVWYATYGYSYIWGQRAYLIRKWHEFRKSMES